MLSSGGSYLVLAGLLSWGVYLIKQSSKDLKRLDDSVHEIQRRMDIREVTINESNRYNKESITTVRSNVKETLHEIQQEVNKVRFLIRALAKEWGIRIEKQRKNACGKDGCPNRQKLDEARENDVI